MKSNISHEFPYIKKFLTVHGKSIAYVDEGKGDPVIFLHGNPTSSYLWRNIIPYVEPMGRVIAPDLIGMGDSDKLEHSGPTSYTFKEHCHYLFSFIDQLELDRVTFVVHDWGSALGFYWASLHAERVKAIVYMEAIVSPIKSWEGWPEVARNIFQAFRTDAGEELILQKNIFVERILAGDAKLGEAEMAVYMKPYLEEGESRRPTLTWPREIPIAGEPKDVVEIVQDYAIFMGQSTIPKLFVNATPGSILVGDQREEARLWPNQQEVTVEGGHFIQEISPNEIGSHIKTFLQNLQ
ncbi:MAG: haloalkane dehalogenase [Chloroflexota bacterium]|nr:haloalkane dehalogenase [Chloroflexota bacterium]MEC9438084.1 haloalkane dehalogenase [Chloroflexota bacterium]MED5428342.1 haloalkane dehalogenase [Chloroflexota bacterium]